MALCFAMCGCADNAAVADINAVSDSIFGMSNLAWLGFMLLALIFFAFAIAFVFFVVWWKNK